jgi:flavin reductase (DIM6/NTAB) family NADH-FMN oxidoreductase RutF
VAVLQTCDSLRDALKQAMRRLASSVTIISANEDGAVYGLAVTAVTSLALDPHP